MELGVMLPVILIMIIGVLETVNLFNHYVTVVNASRDGARIGSKGSATDAEIISLVTNDMDRLPGDFDPVNDIVIDRTPVPSDDAISVETCYDHSLLLHITILMPDTVRICSETTMRMLLAPTPEP